MRKMKVFIVLTLFLCTLTGCWDKKEYEDIGFMLTAGIEQSANGILITYISPLIDPEQPGKLSEITIAEDVSLIKEAREKAQLTTTRSMEAGTVHEIMISREIAENGINDLVSIYEREPANPVQPHLVIVDGSPKELIIEIMGIKSKARPSLYLKKLLEDNIYSSYIPNTKIYNYDINYFSGGRDSIMPMIKYEPNQVKIIGSALLHIDKMVGKIDTRQTSMLLALMGKMKRTEYICKTIDESNMDKNKLTGIALTLRNLKRNIKVNVEKNTPIINITLNLTAYCDESKWGVNFQDQSIKAKIEKKIEDNIKNDCMMVLKYTQQVGSDPLGIGDILRADYPSYWTKTKWLEAYKDGVFMVNVKVHIDSHGLIN